MKSTLNQLASLLPLACLALVVAGSSSSRCVAQEGSLLAPIQKSQVGRDGTVVPGQNLTLENTSFLFQPLPPEAQRELRKNDIITVLVDYNTAMNSDGSVQSRITNNYNAQLLDWLGFDGKSIFAAPQTRGDPAIAGAINSQMRSQTELEANDSLSFQIAATIVDIRPNGNLVIEAHRQVTNNGEVWQQSLTGVVARQFINPDRTVRSDAIAELSIKKVEQGHVRDSTARGWIGKWYGRVKPF